MEAASQANADSLSSGRRPPPVTPSLSSLNTVHTLTSQPPPAKRTSSFFSFSVLPSPQGTHLGGHACSTHRLPSFPSFFRSFIRSSEEPKLSLLLELSSCAFRGPRVSLFSRNILLVADVRYLTDGLKEFDHHSKVDEKAGHVLRDAEVKYCFECGEHRDFKCCHGCFQTCCRDSAKVTDGTGGDDSRVFEDTEG